MFILIVKIQAVYDDVAGFFGNENGQPLYYGKGNKISGMIFRNNLYSVYSFSMINRHTMPGRGGDIFHLATIIIGPRCLIRGPCVVQCYPYPLHLREGKGVLVDLFAPGSLIAQVEPAHLGDSIGFRGL